MPSGPFLFRRPGFAGASTTVALTSTLPYVKIRQAGRLYWLWHDGGSNPLPPRGHVPDRHKMDLFAEHKSGERKSSESPEGARDGPLRRL